MEKSETGNLSTINLSVAEKMAQLMYCYKFGFKEKYFKALQVLKGVMDDRLYEFYFRFGCSCHTWRDSQFNPEEVC